MRSSGPLRLSGYCGGRCWRLVCVAEGRGTPNGRGSTGGGRTGGGRGVPKTARAAAGTSKTPRRSPRPTGTSGSAELGRGRELRPVPDRSRRGGRGPRTVATARPATAPDVVLGRQPAMARAGRPGHPRRTAREARPRPAAATDPANVAFARSRWRAPSRAVGRLRWNPSDRSAAGDRRNRGTAADGARRTARPPSADGARRAARPPARDGGRPAAGRSFGDGARRTSGRPSTDRTSGAPGRRRRRDPRNRSGYP